MITFLRSMNPLLILLMATTLEVSGDALVRTAIYNHAGPIRIAMFGGGGLLLFCYGSLLNLAPFEFGKVVGLYIATLFVVWQIVNFVAFRSVPTLPIIIGGLLIVAGGLTITLWKPA